MEEDGWGFERGEEAGLQRQNTSVQLVRQKETRHRRMAKFLAVALVLVVVGAVPLLITALLGRARHVPLDPQPTIRPDSSPGQSSKQQTSIWQDSGHPSAMLTAPEGNNTNGKYLQWEHAKGIAHCCGGFSYSNGDLVVPRRGLYSVFLQVTYSGGGLCDENIKLMNKVLYFTDEYSKDMPLLSSVYTVSCSNSEQLWSKSLYTAGLFFLEANGTLHVTSLTPQYISKKEYEVFFGAVLLPH